MMKKPASQLTIGAAVLLALAACGGGEGGNDAAAQLKNAGADAAQPATSTPGAVENANSSKQVAEQHVSADVLAKVLTSTTTTPATPLTRQPIFDMSVQWSAAYPAGAPVRAPENPPVRHHQFSSISGDDEATIQAPYEYYLNNSMTHAQLQRFDFRSLMMRLGISANKEIIAQKADAAADSELLTISPAATVNAYRGVRDIDDPENNQLTASGPLVIKKGANLPFDQVLQEWKGDGDKSLKLVLRKGAGDAIQVCYDVNIDTAKRTTCSVWSVPQNWKLNQELNFIGYYVRDDRSVYQGGSGELYWFADRGDDDGVLRTPASGPISERGISAGVLATMFDSWLQGVSAARDVGGSYISPVDANHNKIGIDDTDQAPSISLGANVILEDGSKSPLPYAPVTVPYEFNPGSRAYSGMERLPGDYWGYKSTDLKIQVAGDWQHPDGTYTAVMDRMSISIADAEAVTLSAERDFLAKSEALVPYGQLNTWSNRDGDGLSLIHI